MTTNELLALISAILAPAATIPYAWGIIRRSIERPSQATWILWTTLTAITAVGMHGAGKLSYQISAILLCDFIILGLAFYYGDWKWTRLERVCMAIGIVAGIMWQMTGDPDTAIALSLTAVTVAAFPTFEWTWKHPFSEQPLPWSIMCTSSVLQLISISEPWTIGSAAQPIVYIVVPGIMVILTGAPRVAALRR